MMTLDNEATDGEADPHTASLGCVERVEESVRILRIEPHPRILHRQAHAIAFVSCGSDHQFPRPIVDLAHRVRGVSEQVQDDLLKLDTIARDRREVLGQFCPQSYPPSVKLAPR